MSTVAPLSYYAHDSRLFYSYAGHPPAFLERKSGVGWSPLKLEYKAVPSNLPLGVLAHTEYDEGVLATALGDRVFVYSDGMTDSLDLGGAVRGEPWLKAQLGLQGERTPSEIKRSMLQGLNEPVPFEDDLTFLVVEVH